MIRNHSGRLKEYLILRCTPRGSTAGHRTTQDWESYDTGLGFDGMLHESRLLDTARQGTDTVAAPPELARFKCDNPSPEGLESSRTTNELKWKAFRHPVGS